MERVDEYNITLKVRNNLLLQAFKDKGDYPGQELAEKIGITYVMLNAYIALKLSPIHRNGNYRESVYKICEYLKKLPEELWTDEQLTPLENSVVEFTATYDQISAYLPNPIEPSMLIENDDLIRDTLSLINILRPREKRIIEMRYGLIDREYTYQEIGNELGYSAQRIIQLEKKTLRKLRHPSVYKDMRKHVDPNHKYE